MLQEIRTILEKIGENPDREGLLDTPKRVEKALEHILGGYKINPLEILEKAVFSENADEMIIVKNIEIYSMCEHHLLPFFGKCHIGYIPQGKIYGVSKLARVADAFARRLQVQERLTQQIAEAIMKPVNADGVGVIIEAKHMCMMMRGVEKQDSVMTTSSMLGSFRSDPKTREEFLNLVSAK
ncbi:MAG: GTP cyclohydrolase I FolE [Chitinispirillales bacterium]|nr:GTP cyclohydrolase I FolE [Chitinispirillales bacterium]